MGNEWKYGDSVRLAKKLKVSKSSVNTVRYRMKKGFTNFCSEQSVRIYRALLAMERDSTEKQCSITNTNNS